jgi:hypothetical protein
VEYLEKDEQCRAELHVVCWEKETPEAKGLNSGVSVMVDEGLSICNSVFSFPTMCNKQLWASEG